MISGHNKIIDELLRLEVKSEEYLNKYVDLCIMKSNMNNFDVKHHILPKADKLFPKYRNLRQDPWNCAYLSYEDHFIAHWLLVNAIKHQSISFAFMAMKNKDIKSGIIKSHNIDTLSKEYATIMNENRNFLSTINKNKTNVYDIITLEKKRVSVEEFRNNPNLISVHKNKLCVLHNGEKIVIQADQYDKSIHKFHTTGKANFFNIITNKFEFIDSLKREDHHLSQNAKIFIKRNKLICLIIVRDILISDEVLLDYKAIKIYKNKHKKQIKKFNYINIITHESVIGTTNPDKKLFINSSVNRPISIFDIIDYTYKKIISINEFKPERHLLVQKGIKICIDKNSKKFYQSYYPGISAVKRNINKYIDYSLNKYVKSKGYVHGSTGKITAFNIESNEVLKIDKLTFDNDKNFVGIQHKLAIRYLNDKKQ